MRRARQRPRLEKAEQSDTMKLLLSMGAKVYVIGTRRPGGKRCPKCGTFVAEHQGTCQTEGLPDLLVFLRGRPGHERRHLLVVEQKSEVGRLRPEQKEFRALCLDADVSHVDGTANAVIAWLLEHGYLQAHQIPHYRVPLS